MPNPHSQYQHRVAEAVEAILPLDSFSIRFVNQLLASESRHQHQKGRARQVEVGHQSVDGLEAIPGIDEQIAAPFPEPGAAGLVGAVLTKEVFEMALIVLSSVFGATLVLEALQRPAEQISPLFVILVVVGIVIQFFGSRRRESE